MVNYITRSVGEQEPLYKSRIYEGGRRDVGSHHKRYGDARHAITREIWSQTGDNVHLQ